ncbi:MAG: hypothetical protein M9933_08880 [Chitinophagaceae bacterium]|nr:hypothetical protein [Chitinophagaceae bacterium]
MTNVSAEVFSTDLKALLREGKELAAIHPNIVVKVPIIKEGVKAMKWFTDNGIQTNCTLVFSTRQAILAAKAGAVNAYLLLDGLTLTVGGMAWN